MKKKLMKPIKSTIILCSILVLASICLILISLFIQQEDNTWKVILLSVSCSLIASSVLLVLTYFIYHETSEEEKIINSWGITGIYYRRDKSKRSNPKLKTMKYKWDVIAFGMRSLRDAIGSDIEKRINNGVQVRILTISPNSKFLKQQEIDEGCSPGQIKKTIQDLSKWIEKIKINNKNVEIKYYDALPLDLYFRIDDTIFVGPYLKGVDSQQTITYEYNEKGESFKFYTEYFEKLWNDENFSKSSYT